MKRNSIRRSLFNTYAVIILVACVVISTLFAGAELPKQRELLLSDLQQNCNNITMLMDRELELMHTLALDIAYSTQVRNRLVGGYLQAGSEAADARLLEGLIAALIGPNRPANQVYLYTQNNEIIASGAINGTFSGSVQSQPWFETFSTNASSKSVIYTGEDAQIGYFSTAAYGSYFVSLIQRIYDVFNNPQGYVEVKKSLSQILPAAFSYESIYGESVYIFDELGALLYPLGATPPEALFLNAQSHGFPTEVTQLAPSVREYYVCAPSMKSGFVTIMVIGAGALYAPVYQYLLQIALVALVALILSLIIAFFAAKRFTTPIGKICEEVTSFDLSQAENTSPLDINITELQSLYQSYCDMRSKLIESSNKQMLLQNQEMQSRMLALQSQMNPHFLYNSIAAIQSMADEGMTGNIMTMCQSMANILRYISSDAESEVSLDKEIKCAKDYLMCMDVRYQGDLSYSIDIPPDMNDIKVPKLCVQLLAENAVKFCSASRPPYHISITGEKTNRHYTISIADNGPGFSEDALNSLNEKIEEINKTHLLPSLEISGMGLMNVYLRYKLLHNEAIIFRMENRLPRGACVTIGEYYDEQP